MTKIIVEPKQMWHVRFNSKRHGFPNRKYANFATIRATAKAIAWWMIWDKYNEYRYNSHVSSNKFYDRIGELCDCHGGYGYNEYPPWEDCPLHNRVDGYFKMLHERLMAWILHDLQEAQ